jgi:hypothetical protein
MTVGGASRSFTEIAMDGFGPRTRPHVVSFRSIFVTAREGPTDDARRLSICVRKTSVYQTGTAGFPTPSEWLIRAADARQLADTMTDEGSRQTLLIIAVGYEKMAKHAALLRELNLPTDQGDVR